MGGCPGWPGRGGGRPERGLGSVLAEGDGAAVGRPAVLGLVAVVADGYQAAAALAGSTDGDVATAAAVRSDLGVAAGAVVAAEIAGQAGVAVGEPAVIGVQRAAVARGDRRGRWVLGRPARRALGRLRNDRRTARAAGADRPRWSRERRRAHRSHGVVLRTIGRLVPVVGGAGLVVTLGAARQRQGVLPIDADIAAQQTWIGGLAVLYDVRITGRRVDRGGDGAVGHARLSRATRHPRHPVAT